MTQGTNAPVPTTDTLPAADPFDPWLTTKWASGIGGLLALALGFVMAGTHPHDPLGTFGLGFFFFGGMACAVSVAMGYRIDRMRMTAYAYRMQARQYIHHVGRI